MSDKSVYDWPGKVPTLVYALVLRRLPFTNTSV